MMYVLLQFQKRKMVLQLNDLYWSYNWHLLNPQQYHLCEFHLHLYFKGLLFLSWFGENRLQQILISSSTKVAEVSLLTFYFACFLSRRHLLVFYYKDSAFNGSSSIFPTLHRVKELVPYLSSQLQQLAAEWTEMPLHWMWVSKAAGALGSPACKRWCSLSTTASQGHALVRDQQSGMPLHYASQWKWSHKHNFWSSVEIRLPD